MDLGLTETQEMLRRAAQDFMTGEAPREAIVRMQKSELGLPPDVWRAAAELGWLGILLPERYGGSGGSYTDAGVLFEELGKGPLPGPFFQSAVLSALCLLEAGSEAQRERVLPRIASGDEVVTAAITEPAASWGPQGIRLRAERSNGTYRLDGVKLFAADAQAATRLIVPVRTGEATEDISLLLLETRRPGISVRVLPGFLSWQCEVRFEGVEATTQDLLGPENQGWAALSAAMQKALPVLCAYAVGGCQAVFDMSVVYSQTRMQFGVPIGRFQRVQDHIIRLVNHLDSARWTTYEALWKLDSGADARASVHMAKAVAAEAYLQACNDAHEVHAGIGSVHEYGLVAHTRMSRTLFHYLGDPKWHKRRMADALAW